MSSFYDDASLVVIPSGYKTSKVYAEKPTDGSGDLTFTRTGDTATRVGPDGLIQEVRTNLVLQSEAFNTTWTLDGATVTANSTTAPNGTLTADTITGASGNFRIWQNVTGLSSISYTFSVYAKKGTATSLFVDFVNVADGPSFNFDTKAWSAVANWTTSFQELANGWFRLFATRASNTSSAGPGFKVAGVGQTVFLWGAQMEAGDVATDYIPTTTAAVSTGPVANVPRLDYLGSTCPRLLLEPQRTNGHTFSEQLNNAAWSKLNSTVTANSAISPDGYQNADKLVDNSTSGTHVAFQAYSFASAVSHTISVFAKAAEITSINIFNNVAAGFDATFNLSNGTVTSVASGGTATITAYGNGWYRCAVTATAAVTSANTQFRLVKSGNTSYVGNGTDGLLLWGAQVEAGAYATSYIPTLAASATRGADACSKTGISSLIGQTEGTVFVDFTINGLVNFGTPISVNNGTSLQYIWLTIFANGNLRAELYNGATQASITYSGAVVGGRYKMAFGYKTNDFVLYVNGAQVGTDNSGTTFSGTTLSRVDTDLTNASVYSTASESINQALLFTTRLTNAEMQELTTL